MRLIELAIKKLYQCGYAYKEPARLTFAEHRIVHISQHSRSRILKTDLLGCVSDNVDVASVVSAGNHSRHILRCSTLHSFGAVFTFGQKFRCSSSDKQMDGCVGFLAVMEISISKRSGNNDGSSLCEKYC